MSGEDHWQTRQSRTNVFWSLRHTSGPGGAGSWTVQIQYTIYLDKHKYCGCIVTHSFLSSSRPLPVFFPTSSCLLPVFFPSSSVRHNTGTETRGKGGVRWRGACPPAPGRHLVLPIVMHSLNTEQRWRQARQFLFCTCQTQRGGLLSTKTHSFWKLPKMTLEFRPANNIKESRSTPPLPPLPWPLLSPPKHHLVHVFR